MTPYYLYILHFASIEKYYVGVSQDPETRLQYHNTFYKGWTLRGRPWTIAYMLKLPSKSDALKAEKYVKRQKSQAFIKQLISGTISLDF
jgi:putative endonuclease